MMRTRRLIGIIIFFLSAIVCVHSFLWAAEEKMLSTQVREALEAQFPDTLAALRREYGLHPFVPVDTGKVGGAGQSVILIHGLDDPGLIWQDLAPALAGQGFRVFIMSYPNDQPIRDSAAFFFKQLQELAGRAGRERTAPVAIVGHSMGGLVTREMLTSPAIGYARAEEARLVPPLSHFIMIGTPNHGSVFSRLRLLTEIRDQAIIGAEGLPLAAADGRRSGRGGNRHLPRLGISHGTELPSAAADRPDAGYRRGHESPGTRGNRSLFAGAEGFGAETRATAAGL